MTARERDGQAGPDASATLAVSVVIATYNRPSTVTHAVRSVLAQLPADGELLVIDQTPTYAAEVQSEIDQLASRPEIRWFRGGPPSLPAARNFGLETARGEIVVFVDDDVELLEGRSPLTWRRSTMTQLLLSPGECSDRILIR